jgi:TetR/AcrR family transcriptional regulator, ethionamide resistance regulator
VALYRRAVVATTRRPQSTRQRRRAEIEQQLLEATERLMAEGFAFTELSVDRLATAAGISRATFYIYFEDKRQLLLKLTRQVFTELAEAASLWWDVSERRDPDDARRSIRAIIASYRRHQAVVTAVNEMASYDAVVAEAYKNILDGITAKGQAALERAIAAGAATPVRTWETVTALTWMVERTCQQVVRYAPPDADEGIADALAEIAWRAWYLESASRD